MKTEKAPMSFVNILAFLVFLIILLAGCRSEELSRSTAAKLITESSNFKSPFQLEYTQGDIKYNEGLLTVISDDETKEQAIQRRIKKYMELTPQVAVLYYYGLVDPQVTPREEKPPARVYYSNPSFWHFNEKYIGTQKANKYWQEIGFQPTDAAFPIAQRDRSVEITGITNQGENQTTVEFKWKWKPNEIGKAFDSSTSEFKSLPVELQQFLTGEKIPEGEMRASDWRIDWKSEKQGRALFQKYADGWRLVNINY
ncbi:MAG: hypothetical protein WA584_17700 [Pyrinomonadaceae bacterium]